MKRESSILFIALYLLAFLPASAQKVLYSPFIGNPERTRFEVIGRTGDYYWVQKSKKRSGKNIIEPWINDKDVSFSVYDRSVKYVTTVPASLSGNVIKAYYITSFNSFNQLLFYHDSKQTTLVLHRYAPDGSLISVGDTLASFSSSIKANDFLLIQSEDKSKNLLLAFETIEDSPLVLHSVLYDADWKILSQLDYKDDNITQPYVQYDLINYPATSFDNIPVKLVNKGDWLMLSSSRRNNNYLLYHFQPFDSSINFNEIKLSRNPDVEITSLSLDNATQEATAGILMEGNSATSKRVKVIHYSLQQCKTDFDTLYRFKTISANKKNDENLYEQYLMPVPNKGFVYMKEYGRHYSYPAYNSIALNDDDSSEENVAMSNAIAAFNKNDYTRFENLSGKRDTYTRGDLTLYYLPAKRNDSTWSGIINKEQNNEFNSAYLSYVCMPIENKLVLLYSSLSNYDNKYSTTTILDEKGNALNEGIVFWRSSNIFHFQKARQITSKEIAVPYERNGSFGFAIIRP